MLKKTIISEKFISKSLKILATIIFSCTVLQIGISTFILKEYKYSEKIFTETIKPPESYKILDYEKIEYKNFKGIFPDSKPGVKYAVEKSTEELTSILNKKDLKYVKSKDFKPESENIKFWIHCSFDSEVYSKNYVPFDMYVHYDKTMYLEVAKTGKRYKLKGLLTNDEYQYIQKIYNDLIEKESNPM